MIVAAILAAEIAFWVFLAAGLLARYVVGWARVGGWLLVCVPLVDLALLALTVVDLRRGASPEAAHALAALYLGFSVAFGHRTIRRADAWVAHRFAGGPPPARRAPAGSPARIRAEWALFGRALIMAAIAAALLLAAARLAGAGTDPGPLLAWIPALGWALVVWLLLGPLLESVRRPARAFSSPRDAAR